MTISSMTGYGKESCSENGLNISVELRSVNNRYLDTNFKLPQGYYSLENELTKIVKSKISRGRVDILITRSCERSTSFESKFNEEIFSAYLKAAQKASALAQCTEEKVLAMTIPEILLRKEVFEISFKEANLENEFSLVKNCLEAALDKLVDSRKIEGKNLNIALLNLLSELEELVSKVTTLSVAEPLLFQQRFTAKVKQLLAAIELDQLRMAQEVAIFADKIDVTEELTRLSSHFQQFKSFLGEKDSPGKKLEFLLQEILRELNTTASKSQNTEITILIVNSKSLVEKLKEQVLNIE